MHTAYRPRPQSRRFRDADCPADVLAIYDNGGTSFDRYTVIYKTITRDQHGHPWIGFRGMSAHPMHPQGFGIYSEYRAHEIAQFRERERRQACRWSDLPPDVQRCVRLDCGVDVAPPPELEFAAA